MSTTPDPYAGLGGSGGSGGGGGFGGGTGSSPPTSLKGWGHFQFALATTLPTALARAKIVRRNAHKMLGR